MAVHLYTRYVKILRLVLPVLVVVSLLGLLIWPFWREHRQNRRAAAELAAQNATAAQNTAAASGNAPLQVVRPDYQGLDTQGRPYRITAERVDQDLNPKAPIILLGPSASLTLSPAQADGTAARVLTLKATHGLYDATAQTLDLTGDVVLQDETGYVLSMHDLVVDLASFYAMTLTPVTGEGPQGSLSAQSLNIADKGAVIVLKGPSRLLFRPRAAGAAPVTTPVTGPDNPPAIPSAPLPAAVSP